MATLTQAERDSEAHRSELLRLELDERRGLTVRVAKVENPWRLPARRSSGLSTSCRWMRTISRPRLRAAAFRAFGWR